MQSGPPLQDDEILLRRIPSPVEKNSTLLDNDQRRPNSDRMAPRKMADGKVEKALSCTRLAITSPSELLAQLSRITPPNDPAGWGVCWFRLADVVKIKDGDSGCLEVHPDPTGIDLGHCGIYGQGGKPCPTTKMACRSLAKIARMLTPEQIASIQAGVDPDELPK